MDKNKTSYKNSIREEYFRGTDNLFKNLSSMKKQQSIQVKKK